MILTRIISSLCLYALLMCFSATSALAAPDNLNPTNDQVFRYLERQLSNMLARVDHGLKPGQRGRLFAWSWGYWGRSALLMHKATGEQRFLDLVRDTSLELIKVRDDNLGMVDKYRKIAMPSWGVKYPWGETANEVTAAGLITLPMCQYAIATGDEKIGREAVKTLAAFINERKPAHGGYYFYHDSQKIVEPVNHTHIYGTALAWCGKLDYAPDSFEETALGIYKYWLRFVREDGEGLSWPYNPEPESPLNIKSEAIWKMGVTLELPVALAETGLFRDDALLDRIGRTISHNPIVQRGGIPQFLGLKVQIDISQNEKFFGKSLSGLLSPIVLVNRPDATDVFLKMLKDHPKLFPNGWFGGSRSMLMSYAYLRASGRLEGGKTPQ